MATTTRISKRYLFLAIRLIIMILILSVISLLYGGDSDSDSSSDSSDSSGDTVPETTTTASTTTATTTTTISLPAISWNLEKIPVVVMACNRPSVSRCLDSILKYRPSDKFPIIVSQDCNNQNTTDAILSFSSSVLLIRQPDKSDPIVKRGHEDYINYYKISRHYRYAFTQVFDVLGYSQAIILEDDMEISPDFFDYFESFMPLLKSDDIFCISSWNDNGKIVEDSRLFFRSDFFPGLGWALERELWDELKVKWPATFWDDWVRHPEQRRGRACIRPEISRTFNFGKSGVSGGLFYDDHIGKIRKNDEVIVYSGYSRSSRQFTSDAFKSTDEKSDEELGVVDVRKYLKEYYDDVFMEQVYKLGERVTSRQLQELVETDDPEQLEIYHNNPNLSVNERDHKDVHSKYYCGRSCKRRYTILFDKPDGNPKHTLWMQSNILSDWKLMEEIREDCARTAYKDVVTFKAKLRKNGEYIMIHVAPRRND